MKIDYPVYNTVGAVHCDKCFFFRRLRGEYGSVEGVCQKAGKRFFLSSAIAGAPAICPEKGL